MGPRVARTDATLGAVVTDLSLARMDASTWKTVEQAFHDHAVLVFPGQHLTEEEQDRRPSSLAKAGRRLEAAGAAGVQAAGIAGATSRRSRRRLAQVATGPNGVEEHGEKREEPRPAAPVIPPRDNPEVITERHLDRAIVISAAGRVDMGGEMCHRAERLVDLAAKSGKSVVLDFSDWEYRDSGYAAIFVAVKKAKALGVPIAAVTPRRPAWRERFEVNRIDLVIRCYATMDAALAAL